MKEKNSSKGLITNIIKSIEEVKGEEVVLIDMKKLIIVHATTSLFVMAHQILKLMQSFLK